MVSDGVRVHGDEDGEASIEHLTALVSDSTFQRLEGRFTGFCPFEAVGMVRAEIRHSNYLGYILNPFRPHGFGTSILRSFLRCALPEDVLDSIEMGALNDAEIRREWRNIDLLIVLPKAKRIIAIELKIDASQSSDQLERYRNLVESTWPHSSGWTYNYLFVTKHDETPNDASWTKLRLHHLIDALSEFAGGSEHRDTQAFEMLLSYITMMRRHHLEDKELERTARQLWSKHADALAFLMDRRPDPLQELLEQIREDSDVFARNISMPGASVVADKHAKRILRYAFVAWDNLSGFQTSRDWTRTKRLMLLEIKKDETSICAHLMIGPGATSDRDAYVAGMATVGSGRFISAAEEELATLTSEAEVSYDDLVSRMAKFTQRVFSEFNPILQRVSAQRSSVS